MTPGCLGRVAALTVLACLVTAASAAPTLEVDAHGVIRNLRFGAGPALGELGLKIPKPGWNGMWFDQASWQPAHATRTADGGWRFDGDATWAGGGCRVEQQVDIRDGQVTVLYRLRFTGSTQGEGVRLSCCAPAAALAGQGWLVYPSGPLALAQALPAKVPSPYHLNTLTKPTWFAWQLGEELLTLRPTGGWAAEALVQDDRQFKMPWFEAMLLATDTAQLSADREVTLSLSIVPQTVAGLAQAGLRRVVGGDSAELARVPLTATGQPAVSEVTWSSATGPRWRPVELRFNVAGTWDNPFDPAQVDVTAQITGPDGQTVKQPAFCYQDYTPLDGAAGKLLEPRGALDWRVRWTPLAEGRYQVKLTAVNGGRTVERDAGAFTCQGSEGHGFVRRNPATPYYLRYDDGSAYFAVGENVCWANDAPLASYGRWFERLGQAGGNYVRIWMVKWNLALEWTPNAPGSKGCFYGLGRYSLDNAWRLDEVLRRAQASGIRVMLCLGYHGEVQEGDDYFHSNCWQDSPYNQKHGGPCAKPAEFWTNPEARRIYQQRLRYLLARYGADPTVLSWELWNEVNAPTPWVGEMADYLGAQDVHHHLRTTTYGQASTWRLAGMDYTQEHHYGSDGNLVDSAPVVADRSYRVTEEFPKPFMMGEFGIDWKSSDRKHDPQGVGTNLHNGLWASIAARSFGTAALWYWDDYVDPFNQYDQFAKVSAFVQGVDWLTFKPSRPPAGGVQYVTPPPPSYTALSYTPSSDWRRQPDQPTTLGRDGRPHGPVATGFVYSSNKADLASPLRLQLDLPRAVTAKLTVGVVSQSATLVAQLDGQEIARQAFQAGPEGQGTYKSTKWLEEYKIWQSTFDQTIDLPLPAGRHLLAITNATGDWLAVTKLVIPQYVDGTLPNVDVQALADARQLVAWVHDRASTWQADRDSRAPAEVAPLRLSFGGFEGTWAIEWYDTWTGRTVERQDVAAQGGQLTLQVPPFRRDVALRGRKQ